MGIPVEAAFIAKAGTFLASTSALATIATMPPSMGAQRRVEVDPGAEGAVSDGALRGSLSILPSVADH